MALIMHNFNIIWNKSSIQLSWTGNFTIKTKILTVQPVNLFISAVYFGNLIWTMSDFWCHLKKSAVFGTGRTRWLHLSGPGVATWLHCVKKGKEIQILPCLINIQSVKQWKMHMLDCKSEATCRIKIMSFSRFSQSHTAWKHTWLSNCTQTE